MKDVVFTLTEAEANVLMAALGKFPAEQVFDLITKLRAQYSEQAAAVAP